MYIDRLTKATTLNKLPSKNSNLALSFILYKFLKNKNYSVLT